MDEHIQQSVRKGPKKIIGVPVIPGLPALPLTIEPSSDDINDAADDTEGSSVRSRTPSTSSATRLPWNLGHKDFFPKQTKEKNEDGYETFKVLVERANDWLRENTYVRLFTCETVTWMVVDRPVYTDNGVHIKSMTTDRKTKVFCGLRIWFYTTDDTFYDAKSSTLAATISYKNYAVEAKTDTIKNILSRLNSDLIKKPSAGRVMRMETLKILSEADPDDCYWKEEPQKDKSYTFFIRLFHVFRPDLKPERAPELGIQDFFPEFTQRTPHNQGYETFSDLWKRAARWIYQNVGLKMLNIQSVFVKYKKDTSDADRAFRCSYTEHGCAYNSLHQTHTEYIQVMRIVYMRHQTGQEKTEVDRVKLAYKVFAPSKLPRESVTPGDDELTEGSYEDLGQMQDRMNQWLTKIGSQQLVGMETIPVRLLTGGQEILGSDATFVTNNREKNLNREPWRVNIRMYLTGRMQDLPRSSSRPVSRTSVCT